MRLPFEYLPATGGARQALVLLHGWGSSREIWRPLLPYLRPWADLTLFDLPGCTPGCETPEPVALDALLAALLHQAPREAVYLGWSLGGQLALELAAREPDRVAGLVTLCSNPRFLATAGWPGMATADYAGFRVRFADQPGPGLRRFDSLQAEGSPRGRAVLRDLQQLRRGEPGPAMLAGLEWLATLDQRLLLGDLAAPRLHLLAECDALVPASLADSLGELSGSAGRAEVAILPVASHLAPLEVPGEIAAALQDFLVRQHLLRDAPPPPPEAIPKLEVATSFSRSATHYDSVARLQREVGERLLTRLEAVSSTPATVLDLGCGTGAFLPELARRFPGAQYIGLDLAAGMVEFARRRHPGTALWLVGDAEALPLAADSVDLVYSSLAIQWCQRPALLFSELARVLRPGGKCVFTTLGPGTLHELRSAWAAVDGHRHVNDFSSPAELSEAGALPGMRIRLASECLRMQYRQVRELLSELKTLGAHNMNRQRPAGLTGRRTLLGMFEAYEQWREGDMLPATYDVIYGTLEKT